MTEPNQTLNKGITHQTLNVHNMSETDITNAKRALLTPIIKDKDILDLMIADENFNKIVHKLDYNYTITTNNGEKLVTGNKQGVSLRKAIEELKKSAPLGQFTKASQGDYTWEALNGYRWHPTYQTEGVIGKVMLRVNLRQA